MAGANEFSALQREINQLLAENEELKQMIRILRENQRLREALRGNFGISFNEPDPMEEEFLKKLYGLIPESAFPLVAGQWRPMVQLPPTPPRGQAAAGFSSPAHAHPGARFESSVAGAPGGHPVPPTTPLQTSPPQRAFPSSPLSPGGQPRGTSPQHPHWQIPPPPPAGACLSTRTEWLWTQGHAKCFQSSILFPGLCSRWYRPGLQGLCRHRERPPFRLPHRLFSQFPATDARRLFVPPRRFTETAGAFLRLPWCSNSPAGLPSWPLPATGSGKPPRPAKPSPFCPKAFPPPGRKARKPPSPGAAAPVPTGPPAVLPAPAEEDPQRPPEEPPKESKVSAKEETATKKSGDAKPKDSKREIRERIVGELAFQLDRRILSAIFPNRVRLYGFTVCNIPKKVQQKGNDPYSQLNDKQASAIRERYDTIMNHLKPLGYDPTVHPRLTEQVVNRFGILRDRPEASGAGLASFNDVESLRNVVKETVPPDLTDSCLLLLDCLHQLSQDDGKPLFVW